jgi:predicted protein tyrosine phosphatase
MPVRAASVHVCSLRHVPTVIERIGARRLVSAINAELLPDTPPAIAPEHHLKLDMHDINEAALGATAPATRHVADLLDFVRGWDQEAPLLIHCFAGLSRSTAAAFITLCALNPDTPEEIIARALRRSSDTAVPNRLFVTLADRALRRQGRMVGALACMGPNRMVIEGSPFAVDARHGDEDQDSGVVTLAAVRRAGH